MTVAEVGNLFAKEVLKPKFDKLNPANALKALWQKINIFSPWMNMQKG